LSQTRVISIHRSQRTPELQASNKFSDVWIGGLKQKNRYSDFLGYCTTINCKWIEKIKPAYDGMVERYKGLVAIGSQRKYGIYYEEVFSPVPHQEAVKAALRLFHFSLFFEFCGGRLIYLAPRLKNTFREKNYNKKFVAPAPRKKRKKRTKIGLFF
jgi:hypothetical protein